MSASDDSTAQVTPPVAVTSDSAVSMDTGADVKAPEPTLASSAAPATPTPSSGDAAPAPDVATAPSGDVKEVSVTVNEPATVSVVVDGSSTTATVTVPTAGVAGEKKDEKSDKPAEQEVESDSETESDDDSAAQAAKKKKDAKKAAAAKKSTVANKPERALLEKIKEGGSKSEINDAIAYFKQIADRSADVYKLAQSVLGGKRKSSDKPTKGRSGKGAGTSKKGKKDPSAPVRTNNLKLWKLQHTEKYGDRIPTDADERKQYWIDKWAKVSKEKKKELTEQARKYNDAHFKEESSDESAPDSPEKSSKPSKADKKSTKSKKDPEPVSESEDEEDKPAKPTKGGKGEKSTKSKKDPEPQSESEEDEEPQSDEEDSKKKKPKLAKAQKPTKVAKPSKSIKGGDESD